MNAKKGPARSEVTARVGFRFFPSKQIHRPPRHKKLCTNLQHPTHTRNQIFAFVARDVFGHARGGRFWAVRGQGVQGQWRRSSAFCLPSGRPHSPNAAGVQDNSSGQRPGFECGADKAALSGRHDPATQNLMCRFRACLSVPPLWRIHHPLAGLSSSLCPRMPSASEPESSQLK